MYRHSDTFKLCGLTLYGTVRTQVNTVRGYQVVSLFYLSCRIKTYTSSYRRTAGSAVSALYSLVVAN